jgi:hypothetical protein
MLLPQSVARVDQEAAFWWDVVGDLGCARNAARRGAAQVGFECIGLAREVRSVYKLPERTLVFGEWDIEAQFKELLEKLAT